MFTDESERWLLCVFIGSLWQSAKGLDRSPRSWNSDTCYEAEGTVPKVLMLGKICKYWNIRSVLALKYWKSDNQSQTILVQLHCRPCVVVICTYICIFSCIGQVWLVYILSMQKYMAEFDGLDRLRYSRHVSLHAWSLSYHCYFVLHMYMPLGSTILRCNVMLVIMCSMCQYTYVW